MFDLNGNYKDGASKLCNDSVFWCKLRKANYLTFGSDSDVVEPTTVSILDFSLECIIIITIRMFTECYLVTY